MKNLFKKGLIALTFVLGMTFAATQEVNAKPYGVFTTENPTGNTPVATIVFHNDDYDGQYDRIVHIDEYGQIKDGEDRELMKQAQAITFLPEFYQFLPTNLEGFFKDCSSLVSIKNLECLNTSMVTNMGYLFYGCSSIKELNLSLFDTENVETMQHMFQGCTNLENVILDGLNTSKVWNYSHMFDNCPKLEILDLSKFITMVDEEKNTLVCHPNCINMVANCGNLKKLVLSPTLVFAINEGNGMWNDGNHCDAFQNVGNTKEPCRLYLPSTDVTFILMGKAENVWFDRYFTFATNFFSNKDEDGYINWSGGKFNQGGFYGFNFYFGDEYPMGDTNHDGAVSISDVMMTVNYILSPRISFNLFFFNTDMNKDGRLSVSDVTALVNIILSSSTIDPSLPIETGDEIEAGECDALLIPTPSDRYVNAMQMTVIVPENTMLEGAKGNLNPNTKVFYKKIAPNQYNVIALNIDANAFDKEDKITLQFQNLPNEAKITNIIVSTTDNTLASMSDMKWNGNKTDGITEAKAKTKTSDLYYNLNGMPTPKDAKGIIIHNGKKMVSNLN